MILKLVMEKVSPDSRDVSKMIIILFLQAISYEQISTYANDWISPIHNALNFFYFSYNPSARRTIPLDHSTPSSIP